MIKESLEAFYKKNEAQVLDQFFQFLSFPSVSAQPEHKADLLACKDWLARYCTSIGLKVEEWPTSGHPTLFAYNLEAGPSKPTILLYGHYDVQPVDPLELWESPPFEPQIRNGEVYARGACDDKGQCFYALKAIEAFLQRDGKLPLNVKFVIEGEEEVGSPGLSGILPKYRDRLKADYLAIVDLGLPQDNVPAITLGTRGLVTMTVEAICSNGDMHSGLHGGVVYNPLHALVELFAKMRNERGEITVPGFYDAVKLVSQEERKELDLSFDAAAYEKQFGTKPTGGEKAFSPRERMGLRPTLEINGLHGGYGGEGFKTVLPARAQAKISCRLVPDQEPAIIGQLIKNYLEKNAPEGVKVTVTVHPGMGSAVRTNPSSTSIKAFSASYEEVYGEKCRRIMEGGSIPIVPKLAEACGGEVAMVGVGHPGDQIHAPNEHFGVDRLRKGFLIIARTMERLGQG